MTHTAESLQAAFKYLFPNEVPALKLLARTLPDNSVVINIGAGAGTSGLAFMESRGDLRLITIDINDESNWRGCLQAEHDILNQAGLWSDGVTHVHKDSKEVGSNWRIFHNESYGMFGYVNLVFIDGDHSYEGCKGDITAWLPNIKPGGIMAVHDYKKSELYEHDKDYKDDAPHPKPWPGVDKAVDELLIGKYEQILRVDSLIAFRI
jgi:predicted O-methyltransferase YrrM